MKTIKVGLTTERKSAREFVEAWKRAERGQTPEQPVERLYFLDAPTLLRVLSQQRVALLSELRKKRAGKVRQRERTHYDDSKQGIP